MNQHLEALGVPKTENSADEGDVPKIKCKKNFFRRTKSVVGKNSSESQENFI